MHAHAHVFSPNHQHQYTCTASPEWPIGSLQAMQGALILSVHGPFAAQDHAAAVQCLDTPGRQCICMQHNVASTGPAQAAPTQSSHEQNRQSVLGRTGSIRGISNQQLHQAKHIIAAAGLKAALNRTGGSLPGDNTSRGCVRTVIHSLSDPAGRCAVSSTTCNPSTTPAVTA